MSKTTQRTPNRTPDGGLACAWGEPWLGPHPLCRAHTAATCGVPIEDVPLPDFSKYAAVTQMDLFERTAA